MTTDYEAIWKRAYDPGVPRTLEPYPDRTLLDYLADHARERPRAPAIWFKGATLDWAAVDAEAHAVAVALGALGIRKGDRVALLLPNCPQFLTAEFGAWLCGAVVVPLNPIYTTEELAGRLASLAPRIVITLSMFYDRVRSAAQGTAVERIVSTGIKQHFPPVLKVAFTLLMERKGGHRPTLQGGDLEWASWLAPHRGRRSTVTPPAPGDDALVLLSGGTTGTPKGVPGWHKALTYTARQLGVWLGDASWGPDKSILLPLPLFHSYGACVVQALWVSTATPLALVPNPRDLPDLLKTFARVRPTFFAGVPTLYNALLNHPDVKSGKVSFRSLKVAASGAAPLMEDTKRRFEELSGVPIVEAYSLTEALVAATVNPTRGVRKTGSVGVPAPDVFVKIVDADHADIELAQGAVGEILIRGPQIMRGYVGNEDESAAMIRRGADGHTWCHTADLGYLDEDGYLFIVDRKKDLIKASGMQVWPREIEETLSKHPAIAEAGVRGFADAARGEIAVAFVVLRDGMRATEDEIRAYCKQHLAPFKVPSRVVFRRELPKSMIGKILRRMLTLDEPSIAS